MEAEAKRQFLHFFFGCVTLIAILHLSMPQWIFYNILILIIGAGLSLLVRERVDVFPVNQLVSLVGRKEEKEIPGKGALTFFVGTLIVSVIFWNHPEIVIGAVVVLVFGDSASTIGGKLFGKHKLLNERTLEGTLSGIALAFFYLSFLFPPGTALIAASIGMLSELGGFEDNLTIPIVSGFVLWFLVIL
jgi:dolichol kinase